MEISSRPERDDQGTITGYYGITRDITERKAHEKEQLKIEKLESLGVLAGGIAHDFNNILTGISGNISFARAFLDAAHKASKPLAEAEKAVVRAGELARQLLTFSRGGEPIKKVVSLQPLLNETVTLVLSGSNVKGIINETKERLSQYTCHQPARHMLNIKPTLLNKLAVCRRKVLFWSWRDSKALFHDRIRANAELRFVCAMER